MTAQSAISQRASQDAFDFQPTTRVRFGAGTLAELGECVQTLNGKRVLLVTDAGLMAAGHASRAADILRAADLHVFLFSDVHENPTTADVAQCVEYARSEGGVDCIVALGGGSAMDCAKGFNFLYTNGGQMEDYWGKEKAARPMLPSIGVPTTAGTGSEAQRFALISHAETHRKMACGDIKARFSTVVLDPELLVSVPRSVAASTGMDAITHAVESFVTTARNSVSQLFAKEAWRLLNANFEAVLRHDSDTDAWGAMLLGAHYAGSAIENAMLGAAHACANPLTARFDVVHGTAVGLMLPHVIRFNRDAVGDLYGILAQEAQLSEAGSDPVESLAQRIEALRDIAGLPGRLETLQIHADQLQVLAEDAATQWTGSFNPRPASITDFLNLYTTAL